MFISFVFCDELYRPRLHDYFTNLKPSQSSKCDEWETFARNSLTINKTSWAFSHVFWVGLNPTWLQKSAPWQVLRWLCCSFSLTKKKKMQQKAHISIIFCTPPFHHPHTSCYFVTVHWYIVRWSHLRWILASTQETIAPHNYRRTLPCFGFFSLQL